MHVADHLPKLDCITANLFLDSTGRNNVKDGMV